MSANGSCVGNNLGSNKKTGVIFFFPMLK